MFCRTSRFKSAMDRRTPIVSKALKSSTVRAVLEHRFNAGTCVAKVLWSLSFLSMFAGCGQVLLRQPSSCCEAIPDPGIEESSGACGAERLAILRANLGFQGERLQNGVENCSHKLSECWYSSHLSQWIAMKRDEKNAPPFPKFHPIPTHPALYPDIAKSEASSGASMKALDEALPPRLE